MFSFIKNYISKITNKIKLFFKPKKIDVKPKTKEQIFNERVIRLINEGRGYEFDGNRIHFDEIFLKDLKISANKYNSYIRLRPKLTNFDVIINHNSELNPDNPTNELLVYRDKLNSDLMLKANYRNKMKYDKIIKDMNNDSINSNRIINEINSNEININRYYNHPFLNLNNEKYT
jgi:hypothetical protein